MSNSAITTLPVLSHNRMSNQHSITNRKSLSVGNRSYSSEIKSPRYRLDNGRTIKSFIKPMQTDKKPEVKKNDRSLSSTCLGSVSPSKRLSLIPVPSKHYTSPRKCGYYKKANLTSRTVKQDGKPIKEQKYISPTAPVLQPSTTTKAEDSNESIVPATRRLSKRPDILDECDAKCPLSPTANNLSLTHSFTTITLSSPHAENDLPVLESPIEASQDNSSTYTYEDACTAEEKDTHPSVSGSKSSLGCDFDLSPRNDSDCVRSEYYRLCNGIEIAENEPQVEKLNLSIKDSESQVFSTVPRSTESSCRKSSSSYRIHRTPQTTIRTLSGDELVISSLTEFDSEGENILQSENDETIDRLLRDAENDILDKEVDKILENEAASEGVKTDFEDFKEAKSFKSEIGVSDGEEGKSWWSNREKELFTDVSYRQFMYHPTVMKRQSREERREERTRQRSKSSDGRSSFRYSDNDMAGRSSFTKKHLSQSYVSNRDVNITPLSTWSDKNLPQEEDRQMYDNLNMMHNTDYVFRETKRERTRKERIIGAILRLATKCIHVLALLNLWPGDNCQLLTSHSIH